MSSLVNIIGGHSPTFETLTRVVGRGDGNDYTASGHTQDRASGLMYDKQTGGWYKPEELNRLIISRARESYFADSYWRR
jgi:hypothetical protein